MRKAMPAGSSSVTPMYAATIASRVVDSPTVKVPPIGLVSGATPNASAPMTKDATTSTTSVAAVSSRPTMAFERSSRRRGTGAASR